MSVEFQSVSSAHQYINQTAGKYGLAKLARFSFPLGMLSRVNKYTIYIAGAWADKSLQPKPLWYTAKSLIPIRGRKRARYGTELQYRYVQLGQSHCIFCMGSALQLESTCNPSVDSRP